MAKKALAIVTKETQKLETGEEDRRIWRERALSEEELLHGTDEAGRTGWFLRLTLPGLYPRRIGPYPSHEAASAVHKVYAHLSIEPVRQALDQQAEPMLGNLTPAPPLALGMESVEPGQEWPG